MKQNKEDVKQNLNKENLLQKYGTTEPGLEINNKYYTFFQQKIMNILLFLKQV